MAFAAAKLRQQADLDAPTMLVVLDRLDLIEQVSSEFASVGLPGLRVAGTKDELRRMLREDARGVIVTTIFRFADAGLLNDRPTSWSWWTRPTAPRRADSARTCARRCRTPSSSA